MPPSGPLVNILIQRQYVEKNIPIDLPLAKMIASYGIECSKFYLDGYGAMVDEKASEAFRRIDEAMRGRFQKSLLQMFYPSDMAVEIRRCYSSAVYDDNASYTLKYPDFVNHKPLGDFLDAVLRYTENRLREQANFTGRLRGIELDEIWKSLIDDMLGVTKVTETAQVTAQRRKAKISLDANALSQLRSESEDIRTRLISENQQASEPEKELLTDLRQIMALLRECDDMERRLLFTLYENGWACDKEFLQQGFQDRPPSEIMDEINRIAARKAGVPVLTSEDGQYLVEDDFQDEFDYIYNAPDLMKELDERRIDAALTSEDNPVAFFMGTLDSFYLEVLRLIATESASKQALDEISNLHGTMSDLVVDEINEAFQAEYNDLLIDMDTDSPVIIDEYREAVQKYINEVLQA
jgi:hypothetical protein